MKPNVNHLVTVRTPLDSVRVITCRGPRAPLDGTDDDHDRRDEEGDARQHHDHSRVPGITGEADEDSEHQ
jgi:hypothetical protein